MLNFDQIKQATVSQTPYPHLFTDNVIPSDLAKSINQDFPSIKASGFLPLAQIKRAGHFDRLLLNLESDLLAKILGNHLGLQLEDKPRLITIRKWSSKNDGRIHNDGEAKIATALLYLNEKWSDKEDGGRLRVLTSECSFENPVLEVPPLYGNFFAFARSDRSWHGHKPFIGERRVIQIAFLRSQEDYDRKEKRGIFSHSLKKIFNWSFKK